MEAEKTVIISKGGSLAELVLPDLRDGLYRGVRFDHSGVFREIRCGGRVYSDRWLEGEEDPYRHDNVTGPAEEFSEIGSDEAAPGSPFLKIGVGTLLKADDAPYVFTSSYQVHNPGERSVRIREDGVLFRHCLRDGKWGYDYEKEVFWEEDGCLLLKHRLCNTGTVSLSGTVYNHNFFPFAGAGTGTGTAVDLPFVPTGEWRRWPGDSPAARLSPEGVRLDGDLVPGEKVCIESIVPADGSALPYRFTVRSGKAELGVAVSSEAPLCRLKVWGNHRVLCVEPFTPFNPAPGEAFEWTLKYEFI